MGVFYVTDGPYLASMGACPDGMEQQQALPGQLAHAGTPPGFERTSTPHPGARWHVEQQQWVETRSDDELAAARVTAVVVARRKAYPPLSELADALYWQSEGEEGPMNAYLAAVAAVKAANPKTPAPKDQ